APAGAARAAAVAPEDVPVRAAAPERRLTAAARAALAAPVRAAAVAAALAAERVLPAPPRLAMEPRVWMAARSAAVVAVVAAARLYLAPPAARAGRGDRARSCSAAAGAARSSAELRHSSAAP